MIKLKFSYGSFNENDDNVTYVHVFYHGYPVLFVLMVLSLISKVCISPMFRGFR